MRKMGVDRRGSISSTLKQLFSGAIERDGGHAECASCRCRFGTRRELAMEGAAFCVDCLDRAHPGDFAEYYDEHGGG